MFTSFGSEFTSSFNSVHYSNHKNTLQRYDSDKKLIGLDKHGFIKSYSKVHAFFVKLFSFINGVTFNKTKVALSILAFKESNLYKKMEEKVDAFRVLYKSEKLKNPNMRPTYFEDVLIENTDNLFKKIGAGLETEPPTERFMTHFVIRVKTRNNQKEINALLAENKAISEETDEMIAEMKIEAEKGVSVANFLRIYEDPHPEALEGQKEIDEYFKERIATRKSEIAHLEHKLAVMRGEAEEIDPKIEAGTQIASERAHLENIGSPNYSEGEEIDPAEDDDIFEEYNSVKNQSTINNMQAVEAEVKVQPSSPRSVLHSSLIK